MSRLTDNDKKFGPITYGKSSWNPIRITWSSGGGEDDDLGNHITVYVFGYVARISTPKILRPFKVRHVATSWDKATIARLGRNWYDESFPREYGFSLNEGFLQLFLGPQTRDSLTTKSWSYFLPWTQWRHVRHSYYDIQGNHFWSGLDGTGYRYDWDAWHKAKDECPTVAFQFYDYDGQLIKATTKIEEREWRFGTGYFKWLSWFRKPKIVRSLDLRFSSEVGPEKGSWKGGTIGHSIEMLDGEMHESAFRRYCSNDHRSKSGKFNIEFVGKLDA